VRGVGDESHRVRSESECDLRNDEGKIDARAEREARSNRAAHRVVVIVFVMVFVLCHLFPTFSAVVSSSI